MLTLDKIYHAAFVLKKVARKTDLIKATKLSDHCDLYLKTENLQETGSFKLRGAYYKISQLTDEEKSPGRGHGCHPQRHQVPHLYARRRPHQ